MRAIEKEIEESEYQDYLCEVFGEEIDVCGYKYYTPRVLEEVDPTAYRVGFSDYASNRESWLCSECDTEHDTEEDAEACCTPETV